MKKIDNFIGQYPKTKTIRNRLIPVGETEKNFFEHVLAEDEQRAEEYKKLKKIIDRYHKDFIERALRDFKLTDIQTYADIYYDHHKDPERNAKLEKTAEKMMKEIANRFKKNDEFKEEYEKLFKKGLFSELLAEFVKEDEKDLVNHFSKFTTYFGGFHQNRENMYKGEGKSTEIAYRLIVQNLPTFLDNAKNGKIILSALPEENIRDLESAFAKEFSFDIRSIFSVEHFNQTLTQCGIDEYNQIIGGYTPESGKKIKGYNEYINEYNQKAKGGERKIPKLKMLYKQILSDRSSISFLPEKFESSAELLKAVRSFYLEKDPDTEMSVSDSIEKLGELLTDLNRYDITKIYIRSGVSITELSNDVFGHWSVIQAGLNEQYDAAQKSSVKKDDEKYLEKRRKEFKKIKSYSIAELQKAGEEEKKRSYTDDGELQEAGEHAEKETSGNIVAHFGEKGKKLCEKVKTTYEIARELTEKTYPSDLQLFQRKKDSEPIKEFLDAVKDLQLFAKKLCGSGVEEDKDALFYGEFEPLYAAVDRVTPLYNMVRNYMTQKPYSDEKIKINFNCGTFLSGWSQEYETKGAYLIEKDEQYHLMVIDQPLTVEERERLKKIESGNTAIQIVYQFQKSDNKNIPRIFIRSKGTRFAPAVEEYDLPIEDIIEIYDKGLFKTAYRAVDYNLYRESLKKLIDYFKLGFSRHSSFQMFDFKWKESGEYEDISEFYHDVAVSCYKLDKEKIDYDYLLSLVSMGKVYLFRIYNKDFSANSKGQPNLHTLYFKMLFDERNLAENIFKLDGGAEVFYRKPSIKKEDAVVHKANEPIENKNQLAKNKHSTFSYDIIKDRRYTEPRFFLHMPITINFNAASKTDLNHEVQCRLKEDKNNYVIGIDRGERHLLYICVIDGRGEIVEQFSLNEIVNEYKGEKYTTDYHDLLDKKEKERLKARQNWGEIENIKELKEGYISQVVHKICLLVEKYDAVIALENLNAGFKNNRVKVEKQIYQKFEKMLIDKLNFWADKNKDPSEPGGLLRAYQLTYDSKSPKGKGAQNGFLFFVPPWMTSKIDPVTGFVDLLRPRYTSVAAARGFFRKFDYIRYNKAEDYFEFGLDYDQFEGGSVSFRKKWVLASVGDRIRTFRNSDKNDQWDHERIRLTESFKDHFDRFGISYTDGNDLHEQITGYGDKDQKSFYSGLIRLTALMLQMRNSVSGTTEDYMISPVRGKDGSFYFSDDPSCRDAGLPENADANGAYHIARKAQWFIEQLKGSDDPASVKLADSKKKWLAYVQEKDC